MPIIIVLSVLALGIIQIYAGGAGLAYYWGAGWATFAIFLCLFCRITLPITIGCFFCAKDVWGWHWGYSLLFAAPGVIFVIPSIFIAILAIFHDLYESFRK